MNRAPGPNDNWWADHAARCTGQFVKMKEPEGYANKKAAAESRKALGVENKGWILWYVPWTIIGIWGRQLVVGESYKNTSMGRQEVKGVEKEMYR